MHEILDDTMASWKRERPDLELDAMGTSLRLNLLMNAALRSADGLFTPHGITVGEFDVLAALRRGGIGTVLDPDNPCARRDDLPCRDDQSPRPP